jgi:Ribosomal protein L7/L12 C-terminal domain
MFVPIPVLIVLGLVILGLAVAVLSRRETRARDLMRPPASLGRAPVAAAPPVAAAEDGAASVAAPAGEAADALITDVRLLLMQRRKIDAIKHVRDRQPGMGLKEAKDWVERVEAGG